MAATKNTAIVHIIISDDEDEANTQPSNSTVSYEVKEEKGNNLQKAVISIIIPDDHEKDVDMTQRNEPTCSTHLALKEQKSNCQVSGSTKSATSPWKNLKFNAQNVKKLQAIVKLQKMDVETIEKRFSPEKKETIDIKSVPVKRPKSPPSSSSLRQSKLTDESFSPKKRPPTCPRQVEQPLSYDTPLYCSVQLRTRSDVNISKDFTENQLNSLQALKEENFHQSYLNTVTSFMSQYRKPPPALVFHMLHNILLVKQSSCGTECFRIMQQIQVLHPSVPRQMISQKITWEFISMIVQLSECSTLAGNSNMALCFLISVMEEEAHIKKFSLVKTGAYRLLSAVRHLNHVRDVVQWIGEAIERHASQSSHGCGHNACPVYLLQRMLMLSLLVSERPEDCSGRIADELVLVYNWTLQSIDHKTLLLQSMKSHLLRTKLIEVIITNCCSLQAEQDDEGIHVPRVGLRHIIFFDFKRFPPINNTDCVANCEELIMLLAYLLQSFVFCRKRSLQKNPSDSLRILSMDDTDVLFEIDEEVTRLRERLQNFCSPSPLSSRSHQLLDLMSSLKSFAQKLP